DGTYLFRRQAGRHHAARRRASARAGFHARPDGAPLARFLAHLGGPAGSRQSCHRQFRRPHRPLVPAEQRRGTHATDREAEGAAGMTHDPRIAIAHHRPRQDTRVHRAGAIPMTHEEQRLAESQNREKHWKRWGPYLSERAWGTVREDYSEGGTAWDYLPHDH